MVAKNLKRKKEYFGNLKNAGIAGILTLVMIGVLVLSGTFNGIAYTNEQSGEYSTGTYGYGYGYNYSYTITFYTNPPKVGSITFNGIAYTNEQSGEYSTETYRITANIPSGYKFKNWETSGGVSVTDSTSSSTTATISGDGSLTANFEVIYNREAASNYAQKYCNKVCSDGYFFKGHDCAHFVSCCIGKGGGLDIPSRIKPAYGEPGAQKLVNWLIDSGNAVYKGSIEGLEKGDVILYDWNNDGWGDHVAIYLGDGKIAAHTTSYCNEDWHLGICKGYRFIHINSGS